jgi:CelD/BcsL family acetyltransferase involved in cellulose biosynthesis
MSRSLVVLAISDPDALAPWVPAWDRLAGRAAEANVFMESWFLVSALREFADGERMVLVADGDDPRSARLLGLFPITNSPRFLKVPLPHVSVWHHPLMLLGTPLVDRRDGYAALHALLNWAGSGANCALNIPYMCSDGPVARWLDSLSERHELPTQAFNVYQRAMLHPTQAAGDHLRTVMKQKRRKEIQRLSRRLGEAGNRSVATHDSGPAVVAAAERFFRMELQSWKGRQDTALASDPVTERFIHAVVQAGIVANRLSIQELLVDGNVVATKLNLLTCPAAGGAFAFKIVYDEAFSDYSPGVQLEVENIDWAFAHPHVHWMDSCAAPDHPMINKLWLDRRSIESRLVATDTLHGRLAISALADARQVHRLWRSRGE